MATTARRRGIELTVQGWLVLVLAIAGVLVLTGSVGTLLLLKRTDAVTADLTEDIQPARSISLRLQGALRDQETAVRGYVISADRPFLEPYYDGQTAEQVASDSIRTRVGDHPNLIADLDAIEQAATVWRATVAEPLIASVVPGAPALASIPLTDRGKVEFDRIRALFETQDAHFKTARAEAGDRLVQAQHWRNRVLIAVLVVTSVTAAVLALLVRSAVTRPLAALTDACRRITEGNFDERIIPQGPKDIRAIARDVEDMRQHIVDELDVSRTARTRLTEQAQVLDEQAIELRRSNSELEQFAYVASHDLQEPLRKVASFCQLLEKRYGDQLDERGTEYIRFAVDGAKRMQVLINDLLTFSRVGRLNSTHAEVDLEQSVAEALANVATAIEDSGAQIIRPPGPLPTIIGDPTLLTMLWQNLIGNAVKFSKADTEPEIVIDWQRESSHDEWLFRVSDNGIGISEEFVDKVFVIFQRLHGRDSYGGTGIGLALCKKIVEYHGGAIWIDTSYTGGTRFCFTLPVIVTDGAPAVQEGTPV